MKPLTDAQASALEEALDHLADMRYDSATDMADADALEAVASAALAVGATHVGEHWMAKVEYLRGEFADEPQAPAEDAPAEAPLEASSYLTVNGVRVRLVAQRDDAGDAFVTVDAEGNLEGVEPGVYYPSPLDPAPADAPEPMEGAAWIVGDPNGPTAVAPNGSVATDDPACPACGSDDVGMWAEDGESSDADFWECNACKRGGTVDQSGGGPLLVLAAS